VEDELVVEEEVLELVEDDVDVDDDDVELVDVE